MNENPIMKYFSFEHLPENLQAVSKPIGELARLMDQSLPDGLEKSACDVVRRHSSDFR